jgi:uncharacterized membrane protein YjgN (DUF898 family)
MEDNQSLLDLSVDGEARTNLGEVSRWANFMAVLVLIGMGCLVLAFAFLWHRIDPLILASDEGGEAMAQQVKIMLVFVLIIAIVIVGVLMYFLIRGAQFLRAGIKTNDQERFTSGLGYLKNFFVMYGVLKILGVLFAFIGSF